MICDKNKCIFAHIPKCAGSSVLKFFNSKMLFTVEEHWEEYDLTQHKDYFKFCIVRNPWDRFVSEYAWRNGAYWNTLPNSDMSFRDACLNIDDLHLVYPELERIHLWPQVDVISRMLGDVSNLDFIARFENLQEDFFAISNILNLNGSALPHMNPSKRKHYTEYYDDETHRIIGEKYAKDIDLFGYKFGGEP